MPEYKLEQIQAKTIAIEDKNGHFNLSVGYCKPKHKITKVVLANFYQILPLVENRTGTLRTHTGNRG